MIDWNAVFEGAEWFHWTGITPAISQGAADATLEAVKAAKDQDTQLKLIREGKQLSIKVTPAKRPGDDFDPTEGARPDRDGRPHRHQHPAGTARPAA
mgnify:CR=1 FL=1